MDAGTDRLIDLSPAKRALLERWARRPVGAPPRIPRRVDNGLAPLSFPQERLWVMHQLAPEVPVYNMPGAVRLRQPLDVGRLHSRLDAVAARQESLRTTFPSLDGRPVQRVGPERAVPLELVDLRGVAERGREAECLRLAGAEARRPFDLTAGPLHRFVLYRLGAADHLLLVSAHHIVTDGWSMSVLWRELQADGELPELPICYRDFAAWQRERLGGESLRRELAWWRRRLAGLPEALELPTDRPRPTTLTHAGGAHRFRLDGALAEGLRALARREGVTEFMVLLAAFATLLHRYGGQWDIAIGSPVSGRNWPEVRSLIGVFLNTLVLRVEAAPGMAFRELLGRVRAAVSEAVAHQDLPFEEVVEELQPARDLTRTPLFQVMFNMRREEDAVADARLPIHAGTAQYDLALDVLETSRSFDATLQYRSELFDRATVARMGAHLVRLAGSAVADAERPLSRLAMLAPAERRRLTAWSSPPAPAGRRLHDRFEEWAARAPERPAAAHAGRTLGYGRLDRLAERLAERLRAAAAGPGAVVGVYLEQSLEAVVALLAVLKAGAAYLPLDPAQPPARLSFMLADAGAAVVVTQRRLAPRLPGSVRVLWVDDDPGGADGDGGPAGRPDPAGLAYVVYTSGSTGTPKGVAVTHAAAAEHCAAMADALGLGPEDRVLQFAAAGFDVALEQVLTTLSAGACLVLRGPERWDTREFPSRAAELGLTVANLPTAYWDQVTELGAEAWGAQPATLRLLLVGGEAMAAASVRRWQAAAPPGIRLLNAYGPTEAVITATLFEVPPGFGGDRVDRPMPIGRPLGRRAAYVLDPHGGLLPEGVPGELCLAGPLLARGYLGRPGLTAERFVPDPLGSAPGGRLYRTGDRVRRRRDGVLEYLGRLDRQVKLRGVRIEPGEVEAVLRRHPGVGEAAVVVRDDGSGGPRLVAYLTALPGAELDEAALREFARQELPGSLTPAAFVTLERLPLTPNGKLDRAALPAPDGRRAGAPADGSPRTLVETLLAGLWAELLGVERVGGDDDFFDLGGHSLLATRLLARVREALGAELPLRAVFEAPTLRAMAGRVERARLGAAFPEPIPALPDDAERPLSFAQERLWFLDQLEPGSPLYNIPTTVRLRGRVAVAALAAALGTVVARHDALRASFPNEQGRPRLVVAPRLEPHLPLVDLADLASGEREAAVERLVGEEARAPFDLASGPLLRARLLRLAADEHLLLLSVHHIVCDGWSLEVLFGELAVAYEAHRQGRRPELPALPVRDTDAAAWQRGWLAGEALDDQLAYWRGKLAGASTLELPADRPRPPRPSYRGGQRPLRVGPALTRALRDLGRREQVTPFMTVLAAFQTLLYRYSGQTDVVVGMPVGNRPRPELEGLVGFFANTLVLRGDLGGDPSFRELLSRTRRLAFEAHANQDLPFERLVEALQPERDLGRNPLFQVMFAFQRAPLRIDLPELTVSLTMAASGTAKFDLELNLVDQGEELVGVLEYAADLFDPATVDRMAGHLLALLEAVAAEPDTRLSRLSLLPERERRLVVRDWNATASDYPREACLHQLVEAQARRTPDAVALWADGRTVTYGALERRAERLAGRLRTLGVGPEVVVGVCLERSPELVVALLAVLKAGGAYLPLDPDHPADRLAFMLEDAGAPVLVTRRRLPAGLPRRQAAVVCLDGDQVTVAGDRAAVAGRSAGPVSAGNLAYVVYTSGSTGRPKGAMVNHRGICNYLLWMQRAFPLAADDRMLHHTTTSFDVSVYELFWPLLAGARVVLAAPGGQRDSAYLARLVADQGVTTLHLVPSMLRLFVEEPALARATRLRRLFASGETLPPALAGRCCDRLDADLVNLYGATEVSVDSTFWSCRERPPAERVPAGRPIANTQVYVLDRGSLEPVPLGVPGEIHLGGDSVDRGYLGRPGLTAERFVPDPFSGAPGARLYRSGDLGRWRPDGELEFLGRADLQLKVRGFRVEPGEVEAALTAHPGVGQAAVVARGGRLVAYLVGRDGSPPAAAELRAHLDRTLPEFMVPGAFVVLERLPLTANGKLDRAALPDPGNERPQLEVSYVAPGSPLERVLAGLWAGALGVERVGVHDDFFALGGHSLLAAEVVAQVRELFRIELPLRSLFEAPTLAAMAQALVAREARPGRAMAVAEAVQRIGRMRPEEVRVALRARRDGKAG
jgi:amino acid adenylation domain-containing protein